jgi:hypothetical protein
MSIKDFAERYANAWRDALVDGKIDVWEALLSDDFVFHYAEYDGNRSDYRQHIIDTRKDTEIIRVDTRYLTSEGNLFAYEGLAHFRMRSNINFPSLPPPGKEVKIRTFFLFQTKKDQVGEAWINSTITPVD